MMIRPAGIWITVGGYYLNKFFLETCCIQPALVGLIQLGVAWMKVMGDEEKVVEEKTHRMMLVIYPNYSDLTRSHLKW